MFLPAQVILSYTGTVAEVGEDDVVQPEAECHVVVSLLAQVKCADERLS
jgi:hypothetical protein